MSDGASSEIPEGGSASGAAPEDEVRAENPAEPKRGSANSAAPGEDGAVEDSAAQDSAARDGAAEGSAAAADADENDGAVEREPESKPKPGFDAFARTAQVDAAQIGAAQIDAAHAETARIDAPQTPDGPSRTVEPEMPAVQERAAQEPSAREAQPRPGDDDANAQTTVIPVWKATPPRRTEPKQAAPLYSPSPAPDPFADSSAETMAINAAPPNRASAYSVPPPPPQAPTQQSFESGPDREPAAASGGASDLLARIPRRSLIIAGGLVTVGAVGGIAAAVASSGGSGSKQLPTAGGAPNGAPATSASPSPSPTYPPVAFTTVPANGAANVDPSQPITVTVANGTISSVELSGGQTTSGTLSDDKSTWTSNGTLALSTSYTLQIQATGKDGKNVGSSASFTTLKPTATLGVLEMWPGDGMSVGVGQPIRVQFTNYVPTEYRAAVEKACVVTTTPAVAGAWYWVQQDMMDWRPQDYWQTGTQVSVALNLAGVKAGTHQYGAKNHTLDFTIRGTDLRLVVDTKAFRATCYQNGQVIRTFSIDTGMNDPRFVTWSGTLAVLGKGNPVEMKGDYGNGDKYDELVNWATQITYSGTYVHAAPWDGEIGHVNSSHGCIHASTTDATWFYNLAHVGDVVQVSGTNKNVSLTNGFGDFGVSWSSWIAGSAYGATIGGRPTNA